MMFILEIADIKEDRVAKDIEEFKSNAQQANFHNNLWMNELSFRITFDFYFQYTNLP